MENKKICSALFPGCHSQLFDRWCGVKEPLEMVHPVSRHITTPFSLIHSYINFILF